MLTVGLLAGLIVLTVDAKILSDVVQEIVNRIGFQPGGRPPIGSGPAGAREWYPGIAVLLSRTFAR